VIHSIGDDKTPPPRSAHAGRSVLPAQDLHRMAAMALRPIWRGCYPVAPVQWRGGAPMSTVIALVLIALAQRCNGKADMDPTIVAAIVNASGGVITELIKFWAGSEPDDRAQKTIAKTYEKIASVMTTNSVRVLIALRQAASKQSDGQILGVVEPMRQRQEPTGDAFEVDLTYRMRFLSLLGLVQPTLGEHAITHLGVAFLEKAREDRLNYSKAFLT
jgi:hypothetical protein